MPGPGGGSSSGGGFGGGSFGGSGGGFSGGGGGFGGGSFGGGGHHGGGFGGPHAPHHHGPHHHGPMWHRPFRGGWFWGPTIHVGGGCFSGVVVILFVVFFFIMFLRPTTEVRYEVVGSNDNIIYNEGTMQDYANEKYKEIFGEHSAYEDNILLVFLTNEGADGYYTIAWVGDNVKSEINKMFGEYSEYGEYLSQYINTNYYAYTLDSNLADVVNAITKAVSDAKLGSSFKQDEKHDEDVSPSRLVNFTEFEISKDIVNSSLQNFTEVTGIPCCIVVDSVEKVFGGQDDESVTIIYGDGMNNSTSFVTSGMSFSRIILLLPITAIIILIIVLLIIRSKKSKQPKNNAEANKNDMPWES